MRVDEFPAIGYAGRIERLRAAAAERGLDGVLVTDLTNIRWLTGFTGSSGKLVVAPDEATLVTDGRYRERATDEIAGSGAATHVVTGLSHAAQHQLVADAAAGLTRVGAEDASLTHAAWQQLVDDLPLEPVGSLVAEGRRSKDAGEIARIEFACRCADAALAEVAPMLGDGLTEAHVRTELSTGCGAMAPTGRATTRSSRPDRSTRRDRTTTPTTV